MDWTDVMVQRDELVERLEPTLGRTLGRERANDIIQALVCCDDEEPQELVLRMLLRDLQGREARAMAVGVAVRWDETSGEGRPVSPRLVRPSVRTAQRVPRQRRETRLMGLRH